MERAVTVSDENVCIVCAEVHNSQVEDAIPVHEVERYGNWVKVRRVIALFGEAGRGARVDERIRREVADGAVVDQIQAERPGSCDPADGHGVDRGTDGRYLGDRRGGRPRDRENKIGEVDARHSLAEGGREADASSAGRGAGRRREIDRLNRWIDRIGR